MDKPAPDYRNALERLFFDKECNNMEIKFLSSYFGLKANERKAFCELIEKMFPDAVRKIVGDDPLGSPYGEAEWQEAPPLVNTEVVDQTDVGPKDDSTDAAEAAYKKSLGFAPNTGLSALNTTGDTASQSDKANGETTEENGGGESGDDVG